MTVFRKVKKNGKTYTIPIKESSGSTNFIQKSVKHPGRVREYIERTYGKEGFTEKGTIKMEYLLKAKQKAEENHNRSLVDAIDLAIRLKTMNKDDPPSQPYGISKPEAEEEVHKLREEGEHARLIETNRKKELYAPYEGKLKVKGHPEAPAQRATLVKRPPKETIELYDEGEKPYIAEIIGPDKNYHYERKFISDMRTHEGGSKRHPIYKVHFKGELPYGTIVETQDRAYMVVPRSNRFPHGLRGIGTEGMPNRLKMNKLFEARNRTGYHKKIKPEEEKQPNFLFYR